MTEKTEPMPPDPITGATPAQTRSFTTAELFAGTDEIRLLHNGSTYRLRVTRQDKLILTK